VREPGRRRTAAAVSVWWSHALTFVLGPFSRQLKHRVQEVFVVHVAVAERVVRPIHGERCQRLLGIHVIVVTLVVVERIHQAHVEVHVLLIAQIVVAWGVCVCGGGGNGGCQWLRCALIQGGDGALPSALISSHTAVHQRFSSETTIALLLSGSSAKRLLTICATCLAATIFVMFDIVGRLTAGEGRLFRGGEATLETAEDSFFTCPTSPQVG
jgi:hypothetical protein